MSKWNGGSMRRLFSLFALVFLALGATNSARASRFAWNVGSPDSILPRTGGACCDLGDVFTSNSNESVEALGISSSIPYTTFLNLALYDSTGQWVTGTSISPAVSNSLNGYYWNWAYGNLTAGQQYTLVVYTNGNVPGYAYTSLPPTNNWATFLGTTYGGGPGLGFTTAPSPDGVGFYDANILVTPAPENTQTHFNGPVTLEFNPSAPEPESLVMVGTGLIGLAGLLKFRLGRSLRKS